MSEEYFPWVIHDGGKSFAGVVSGDYLQGEALIDGETQKERYAQHSVTGITK